MSFEARVKLIKVREDGESLMRIEMGDSKLTILYKPFLSSTRHTASDTSEKPLR